MKLQQLQKEFAAHLYNKKKDKIFDVIQKDAVPVNKRLQIYHNNVFGNFDSVLEMVYPKTKEVVGDDYFENLANIYHQKYRSLTGNLDDYGKYFPNIISNLKKEHQLIYLKDLAKLEWFYHQLYFSKDAQPIDVIKLQNLKEKDYYQVKFKLHPSCKIIKSTYPIFTIWNINKKSTKKINLNKNSGEMILLERCHFKSNIHKLDEQEYQFLQMIKKQNNIYQIYKNISKIYPEFDIGALINKYISNGVLSEFQISTLNKF